MLHEVFVRLFMELLIFKSSLLCLVFSCSRLMTSTFRGHLDFATKLAMGKTHFFLNSKETTLHIKALSKCAGSLTTSVILMPAATKHLNSTAGK